MGMKRLGAAFLMSLSHYQRGRSQTCADNSSLFAFEIKRHPFVWRVTRTAETRPDTD